MSLPDVDHQRAIIDRRAIADRLTELKSGRRLDKEASAILADALASGREEIARRLREDPAAGRAAARATAFLHDQLVRLAYELVTERVLDSPPTLALVGLGGTGRGEMAPFSDLDLMVLTAKTPTADEERAAEAILHIL